MWPMDDMGQGQHWIKNGLLVYGTKPLPDQYWFIIKGIPSQPGLVYPVMASDLLIQAVSQISASVFTNVNQVSTNFEAQPAPR